MKYDLDKTVVHCTTQEEFDKVLQYHHLNGHKWLDGTGDVIKTYSNWRHYQSNTFIGIGDVFAYGNVNSLDDDTLVLLFSQFERDFLNKDITKQPEPSVKNDFKDNKLRWDLLPLDLIEEVVKVYQAGAKKYGANRWQNLEDGESRYFAAMMRHIRASQIEDIDEDTGCYHLAQICFNALAMLHLKLKGNEKK